VGCSESPDLSSGHAYIFSKTVAKEDLLTSNAEYVVYANFYTSQPVDATAITMELPSNLGNPGDRLISSNGYWFGVPSKIQLPATVNHVYERSVPLDAPTLQIVAKGQTYQQRLANQATYKFSASNPRHANISLVLPDDYGQVGQYPRFTTDGKLFNIYVNTNQVNSPVQLERTN